MEGVGEGEVVEVKQFVCRQKNNSKTNPHHLVMEKQLKNKTFFLQIE